MVKRDELIQHLNELLRINEFDDLSLNGLQVAGKETIERIVLGVSVSERLFRAAIEKQADLVVVHHGAFWKNAPTPYMLTGLHGRRMSLLIKHDINLVAYHLPLDAHPVLGNNAQLLKRLKLEAIKPVEIGFLGRLRQPMPINQFVARIDEELQTTSQVFAFGAAEISQVLVLSGGSSPYYHLALENGADTLVGGDMREHLVRELEEVGLNFINA
ncbi:MAG: Nif3-like dinuclear metal center hexameric protein, partial [candidate division KSB1 bacterium]|nr:Nif3-like dinuclear metal center hexameric protein [candidate division KSB1 bacterium]